MRNWIFWCTALLLALLLFRNPFSQRTLIPNLEPFPDSIHYVSSAFSFIKGEGFVIEREGRTITPNVPPLYSLSLVPMYIIIHDVRAFYFTNVLLSFLSLWLFYRLVTLFFQRRSTQLLLMFLFVTHLLTHWFPTLAMAENLIMPLFLAALLLLFTKVTTKKIVLAGFIAIAFYGTKYASLPLSVALFLLYGMKLFFLKDTSRRSKLLLYGLCFVSFGALYCLYEYVTRNSNIVGSLLSLFFSVFFPKAVTAGSASSNGSTNPFFSTQYMMTNARAYFLWLLGLPETVLWNSVTLLPQLLAFPAAGGLVAGLFTRRFRVLSRSLILFLALNIVVLMTFYAHDGRYFIIALPCVILGLGVFLETIANVTKKYIKHTVFSGFVLLVLLITALTMAMQLKFWIMLNLKYAETPWYYISIRTFDTYLQLHKQEFSKEPVVVSALIPYMIDYYAHEKFIVLPLNAGQDFRSNPKEAWGNYDFTNLMGEYERLLQQGHPVFLTQYGLGNEAYLHESFDAVRAHFPNTLVQTGCYDLCNVYQLALPKKL